MAKHRIWVLPAMDSLLLLLSLSSAFVGAKNSGAAVTEKGVKEKFPDGTALDSSFKRNDGTDFEAGSAHVIKGQRALFTAFMTADVDEVSGRSFDYIIIGGGTTGCPLAATLSERYSVLIIERGGSPYGNPDVEDRNNYGYSLFKTDEFTSVAQAFVSEEGVSNRRGRVLGGSTAINAGFYSRASQFDIERAGWNAELVKEAYRWVESKVVFRPNPLSPLQSAVKDALIGAGIVPFNGFSLEHLAGTKIGGSIFDGFGKRHTSADLLRAGNRKRITVLLNATVQSIIFHRHKGDGKKPRAEGVRFIRSHGNTTEIHKVYLKHLKSSDSWGDVILSAGALSSPQILMLSGIGSKKHLKHLNIPVLINTRHVGKGMQDNPSIYIGLNSSQSNRQPDPLQVVGLTDCFRIIIQLAAFRMSSNSTIMPLAAKLTNPLSRGYLKLRSRDPRQNPSVKFNYLVEEMDLDECVKMTYLLNKIATSKPIYMFLGVQQMNIVQNGSFSEKNLRNVCKKTVRTYYHFHGGCLVGSVVDKDYRVFGVKGLRVVDGSTLTNSPGTNPMATLMMLGRYQGIKILGERQGK